jgi:hypothetical protein
MNDQWYTPGGPIFILLSGEQTANTKWIDNPNVTYLVFAQKYNAAAFLLEHRYYGLSRPFRFVIQ